MCRNQSEKEIFMKRISSKQRNSFSRKFPRQLIASRTILFLLTAAGLIPFTAVAQVNPAPAQLLSSRDSSVVSPSSGDGDSVGAVVSPDGRFVVFSSVASDLVPEDDREFYMNVYLRDRTSNTTVMASVNLAGTGGGDGHSMFGQVSTNGQFVLFESDAGNLVAGSTNWIGNIYVRDMQAETTKLVSVATNGGAANGRSYDAMMTPDGHYVTFISEASNLVSGDNNGIPDVFVRDMIAGTTAVVSVGAAGPTTVIMATPQITPDGRYVAFFSSATGMVAGASMNGETYIRDLSAGTTIWASAEALGILQPSFGASVSSASSYCPRMSDDGQRVAFKSGATNLTGGTAILVYNHVSGTTTLVTTNAPGSFPSDENRYGPDMTPDGRFIAYVQAEPDGTNSDVYVWNSSTASNILVSSDEDDLPANAISDSPNITSNGQFVVFLSNATNLVTNAVSSGFHIYLHDLQSNTTQLVDADTNGAGSTDVAGTFPSVSADGELVVFSSSGDHLVNGDSNNALDVFARDTVAKRTELISQRDSTLVSRTGNGITRISPYSISADGRWVVFKSFADDLVPDDTNGFCDVFLRDLWTGQTSLVSTKLDRNPALGGNSDSAVISGNGRYVAFASAATNLTANTVTNINIFRRDLQTGTTILISANANPAGGVMTNYSDLVISSDGRYVAFLSSGKTVQYPFGTFWRDANSNAPVLLGSSTSPFLPSMSADGRYVAYQTSLNLTTAQLRIRDTQLGIDIYTNSVAITSAAISPDGSRVLYQTSANIAGADQVATGLNLLFFNSAAPVQSSGQWSSDGRYVVFVGITNAESVVYLCDLLTGSITLVSRDVINSGSPDASSDMPVMSDDGRFVAYRSYATDIVAGDTNPAPKIYLFDQLSETNSILCAAQTGLIRFPWISAPVISAGAENVAFLDIGSDLASDDLNRVSDAFAVRVLFHVQLSPVVTPGATTTLTWQVVPTRTYKVQFKDNLNSQWQDLPATIIFITGDEGTVIVPANQPSRFYRIVETP
jgi:Tol biopolymer transport system component